MNYSVALCLITYERCELVREFLTNCSDYYVEAGIDIYIYDSSRDDETQKLVNTWPKQKRLFYVRVSSKMNLYDKELAIFREHGKKQKYDFVWLYNDSTQYSREDLDRIVSSIDASYDYIVFDNEPGIGTREFSDPEELFDSYCEAYHVGASMINVHTMLFEVDWRRYLPIFRNDGGESFLFYYTRFLELSTFRAKHVEIKTRRLSALKKKSVYNDDNVKAALRVVHAFGMLSDYYSQKWEICRRFNAEALMGTESDFCLYHRQGVFSLAVLLRNWRKWDKMTYLSRRRLLKIALIPRCLMLRRYDRIKEACLQNLLLFCDRHDRIMIYGAGNHGAAVGEYLMAHKIDFDAYCVSKRKPGKDEFMQHPVCTYEEIKSENVGFIVALSRRNTQQVLPALMKGTGRDHIFFNPWFEVAMREEMGYQAYSAI